MTGPSVTDIAWAPLLPWETLAALAIGALILILLGAIRRSHGVWWRLLPFAVVLLVLANPQLVREARSPLDDVAVILIDESASQDIPARRTRTAEAVRGLRDTLAAHDDLDLRIVRADGRGADGTRLFGALEKAFADVPQGRRAGAILVTDGQVHDVPDDLGRNLGAPVHTLLTGTAEETDRRLVVADAPSYGLVGKPARLRLRVEDPAVPAGNLLPLTVTFDDGEGILMTVPAGETVTVEVPIDHAGPNVAEVSVPPRDGELTPVNNRVAFTVNGVRDRLRVLLVSGKPHVGERAWRRLLRADPNVDLVHFTILRPPHKDDGTPLSELALIAFPIHELFEERLAEFDLVIFDRYSRQGLVPFDFLENIAAYVRDGGALLQAVGPEYANDFSLFDSPLSDVLPAAPTGAVRTGRFTPRLSEAGTRHPVTAALPGSTGPDGEPAWGDWLRHVMATDRRGEALMVGAGGAPLLVLDRVGEGRVALLLSDTIWLWARDWDGGGPQPDLVRRLAHWLMKEPELEEEALAATAEDGRLVVERRTLAPIGDAGLTVTVTPPGGEEQTVTLTRAGPGRARGAIDAAAPGVWAVTDGRHTAVAAIGPADPLELRDMTATDSILAPVSAATGGGLSWLGADGLPEVRRTSAQARRHAGAGWIGLRANGDYVVDGVTQSTLLPTAVALALILGSLLFAWWREGR